MRKINVTIKNPDLVNINTYAQFGHILLIISQDSEKKQNFEFSHWTELCTKCAKSIYINSNLDYVNIHAYTKFDKIL